MKPLLTPTQTVGPFFHDCLLRSDVPRDADAVAAIGAAVIHMSGFIYDGDGVGVPDAMLEWWHADRHAVFSGFGRVGTAVDGAYAFTAVRPGRVQYHGNVQQAPHISLAIFARGLLNHLFTRIYLPNEPSNADDPILLRVPADRRSTLIARQDSSGVRDGEQRYRFDVVLQGAGETVFFDFK